MGNKRRTTVTSAIIILMLCLTTLCNSEFGGGTGTIANPWVITTAEHLNNVRNYLGAIHNNKYFIQNDHIDLGVPPWNEDGGWVGIGTSTTNSFRGSYDGNGYTIANLTINRPAANDQALFRYTEGTRIRDIGLLNVNIKGNNYIAGLIARAGRDTRVERCYVSGYITGSSIVGGLIANLDDNNTNQIGYIRDSYTNVEIYLPSSRYSSAVGGILGHLRNGTLLRNYAAGPIFTQDNASSIGAIIGGKFTNSLGTITDNYWSYESSLQNTGGPDVGEGNSIRELTRQETFTGLNFDTVWRIDENNSYPYLQREGDEHKEHHKPHLLPPRNPVTVSGNGTVSLFWQPPDAGTGVPDSYDVYRDNSKINMEPLVLTEFQDTGLTNFHRYQYHIKAVFGDRESIRTAYIYAVPYLFAGGSGTEDEPFLVENIEQLRGMKYFPDYFQQIADIDLGIPPYNEGEGWQPISSFSGYYDGNGYKILNLTINNTTSNSSGLFRAIGSREGEFAIIHNLALHGVNIVGGNNVGGIAAIIYGGIISGSYVSGYVSGLTNIGGFIGSQEYPSIPFNNRIINCYSNVEVHSRFNYQHQIVIGGMIGKHQSYVNFTNCYVAGAITYEAGDDEYGTFPNVGALVGNPNYAYSHNSYFNTDTTGLLYSQCGAIAKNNLQMTKKETFRGWDFDEIWDIGLNDPLTYPWLRIQQQPHRFNISANIALTASITEQSHISLNWSPSYFGEPDQYVIYRNRDYLTSVNGEMLSYIDNDVISFRRFTYYVKASYEDYQTDPSNSVSITPVTGGYASGLGTAENPYRIATPTQLDNIRYNPSAHYVQQGDIDMSNNPNWIPIGSSEPQSIFTGSYNGKEYRISNLRINRPNKDFVGLFGVVGYEGSASTLKNINLDNVNIIGSRIVGGVAGVVNPNTIIDSCSVSGVISSSSSLLNIYIGGLIGYTDNALIRTSSTSGSVEATGNYVGGLIGYNYNSSIENCFSVSHVRGEKYVGGFLGYHRGIVTNSYSRGRVTGQITDIGGFIGHSIAGEVSNCYSTGRILSPPEIPNVGGLIGYNHSCIFSNSYWDVDNSTMTTSAAGYGRTTDQMTYPYDQHTYVDWDFENIWSADTGSLLNNGYPYLYKPILVSIKDELLPKAERITLTNYPNPFNPDTAIEFNLPQDGLVELDVFNIKGQKIRSLHNSYTEAGKHSIIWNGTDDTGRVMPSGVYLYRITTERDSITRKMMMVK